MESTILFENGNHRNVLLPDFTGDGTAVQANQHLIVDGNEAMILDPGGHKVYTKVSRAWRSEAPGGQLRYIFCSHQDPDIVAAANGWLMTTKADLYVSALWMRFVPHFGVDRLVTTRMKPIPDEGMHLALGQSELVIIPAHFLHSCGNFQVYDPIAKTLYTGDLGASVGQSYEVVTDFDTHRKQHMDGFHRRYMASNCAMRLWVDMVSELDIENIAPQHGAMFMGREMVAKFLDWAEHLECGLDVMADTFKIPQKMSGER